MKNAENAAAYIWLRVLAPSAIYPAPGAGHRSQTNNNTAGLRLAPSPLRLAPKAVPKPVFFLLNYKANTNNWRPP
ncbi:hypothetical protein A2U01_0061011 [Trifolium medium]|uniref:Uncharacterized protein n=1 Tax=Trifolium medium TaxID=97028 RepID=A0A392RTS7_9FABA|nr:hypothetical protein [Trifolium medium]